MIIIYFFYGLFFAGMGLAAYLQLRRGGDFPLRNHLPWLAAFGFVYGAVGWIEMFQISDVPERLVQALNILRIFLQIVSGAILLIFGWRSLTQLAKIPSWAVFIPGVLVVPIGFVLTYAITTFITPSPVVIPIDIWSRYLLYLPGSIMAGVGFLMLWREQRLQGQKDVGNLMLGVGLAFLFEAFMVGLVVPAAPYGPASYYNYDRTIHNAFTGEQTHSLQAYGLNAWLDYQQVLTTTGLPIQFWRLISAAVLTAFVIRGLDVFETIRKRQVQILLEERNRAEKASLQAQIAARQTAESWTEALVSFGRRIAELEDIDKTLLYIIDHARRLLKSDIAAIALWDNPRSALTLKYYSSDEQTEIIESRIEIQNNLVNKSIAAAQPYLSIVNEAQNDLDGIAQNPQTIIKAVAIAPLTFDIQPIGALWIARSDAKVYTEMDLIWLECIADQVVIAIKHGLMTAQLQTLSVVDERARIAREMHDGLSQILGYMNLQVQTLDALVVKENYQTLRSELKRMRDAVQLAHADVRENILSLRTTLAQEAGLIPAMLEYIEEFGLQTGIKSQFMNHIGDDLELSSIAEVQLVCILQEMLANVRKHAQAKQVIVQLTKEEGEPFDYIHLTVIDDGVGFNLADSRRNFGLKTMRERAESVNGKFMVHSRPGEGARVECQLPCLSQEQLHKPSIILS